MDSPSSTPVMPPVAIDPLYLERVAARPIRLERVEIGVRQDIAHTESSLVQLSEDLHDELSAMHKDIDEISKETDLVVIRIKETIGKFKNVVKKNDMDRIQTRIDVWNPQGKVSREQFKRMLANR